MVRYPFKSNSGFLPINNKSDGELEPNGNQREAIDINVLCELNNLLQFNQSWHTTFLCKRNLIRSINSSNLYWGLSQLTGFEAYYVMQRPQGPIISLHYFNLDWHSLSITFCGDWVFGQIFMTTFLNRHFWTDANLIAIWRSLASPRSLVEWSRSLAPSIHQRRNGDTLGNKISSWYCWEETMPKHICRSSTM